ncbi:MAG: OmpA family protein [Gammaproteobacteria bacterium]|nr:OmpA family protein [Gammaproteobacteria bacterium]MBU1654344.1 OmpA family protein [Gammaproteobacteria bacterium]MBU1962662.1 OmpA family protein [Gammaproteobacteria bacterium]
MLQNKVPATETSLTPEQLQAQTRNRIFVEQAGSGRDITVEDRNRLADIARDRPNADMEVTFTYDSATITPEATGLLIRLGRALADTRLASDTFMVAGHTDARGADDYNQRLSQRRAQAVKDFLVSNFDIAPRSLIAVGYGEEQLKNRYTPEAAENRRVQVVNMVSEVGQSSR